MFLTYFREHGNNYLLFRAQLLLKERHYIPADCPSFRHLISTAEDRLLSAIILNSAHVLGPFPPSLSRDLVYLRIPSLLSSH